MMVDALFFTCTILFFEDHKGNLFLTKQCSRSAQGEHIPHVFLSPFPLRRVLESSRSSASRSSGSIDSCIYAGEVLDFALSCDILQNPSKPLGHLGFIAEWTGRDMSENALMLLVQLHPLCTSAIGQLVQNKQAHRRRFDNSMNFFLQKHFVQLVRRRKNNEK